eukprot:CAMPEP_0178448778 /NCGR_PEP_ID=MMETSP0689_2-20121128/42180_1 /TAXON_ID=160604 /ORGANISM="Amphidinium massartii, Strain CS-259" /LENGTH=206 /DNA_ID=CAMNT_0020074015 /DNA_START=120 /DNA_END=741 /DNA_ORIENTATION=-
MGSLQLDLCKTRGPSLRVNDEIDRLARRKCFGGTGLCDEIVHVVLGHTKWQATQQDCCRVRLGVVTAHVAHRVHVVVVRLVRVHPGFAASFVADMPKLGAKSRSNRSRPSPDCVESASSESPPPVEVEWQDSSKSSLGLRLAAVGVGSHDLDRTRVMPGVASSNSRNPFLMMHPCGTPIIPPGLSESRCQATDPKGNTKLNAMCSL